MEHCIEGAPGHALYGRIAELIRPTDEVFEKPSFGSGRLVRMVCAQRSRLIQEHRAGGPRVQHLRDLERRAAKAACPKVPVIVDAACTASFDDSLNGRPSTCWRACRSSDQPGFGGLAAC